PDDLPPQRHAGRELEQRGGQRLRRAGLLPSRVPKADAAHDDVSSVFPPAPDPLPADRRARDPAPGDVRDPRPATRTRPASSTPRSRPSPAPSPTPAPPLRRMGRAASGTARA